MVATDWSHYKVLVAIVRQMTTFLCRYRYQEVTYR